MSAFISQYLAIKVGALLCGQRVVRVLERLRGVQVDDGPEFRGKTAGQWAFDRAVKMHFIEPGEPTQNGHIESFDGKVRDECLNMEWFESLSHTRRIIESWRENYNTYRTHGALNNLPPALSFCHESRQERLQQKE